MGISSILRGVGSGAMSVGRAVQGAMKTLDQGGPSPDPEQTPEEAPKPSTPEMAGFSLPDIGGEPDPNDPAFSGEEGKAAFESAMEDYAHKQDIHQAFMDLDKVYSEAHPGRNFQQEYMESLKEQQGQEEARPKGSNFARAALALGDFNPAVQQSGRSGLDEYNKRVDAAGEQSDEGFSKRMTLRQKMHEAAAQAAEQEGNWRKALAEHEKAALMKVDTDSIAHRRSMEKETAKQDATTQRATIRADSAKKTAQIRADVIASNNGLTGNFLKEFQKEVAKQVAKNFGPRDLTKEYDVADLDRLTDIIEVLADQFHDKQYGDGSSDKYGKVHPSKRPKPKEDEPAGMPKF